ncbi:hypothetical protein [Sphingomonas hankookensis]
MKVETLAGEVIALGITEVRPTVGIVDYSRRQTDDFGTTTLVRRGFSRTMSLRFALPFDAVADVREKLADLRATKARWIADDRYRALSITGLFKDFDIDVASPPQSYCTLTVEGLAQTDTAPDPGGDPAVGRQASTFLMVHPVATTEATLGYSSVSEDDAPSYSAAVTYGKGARVLFAHRVYESLFDGNVDSEPGFTDQWLDTGPANRWRMFDEALGTATSAAGQIVVTLNPDAVDAVALLDVVGATVRVQVPGYDRTAPVAANGTALFLDLPLTSGAGNLTVTVAGPGTVAVGTMLAGRLKALGVTEASPSTGITDYSRKETDAFGEVTIVPRAWAKRMEARTLIRADALDAVFDRLASVRARNALWIGDPDSGALTTYGFVRDFSIEVDDGTAKLSLSIEGMSEAAKVKPLRVGLTPEQERAFAAVQSDLGKLLSDDMLTRGSDKLTLLRIYDDVTADRGAAHAQSLALNDRYGGDPTFTQRRALDDAIAALDAYLNGLSPPWSDITVDTPADGAAMRERFRVARVAVADLDRANEDFIAVRTKAALDQIVAIGSDAVLSKGEKPETKIRWDELYNENESLYNRFLQLGQPAEMQPLIAAMLAARDALSDYLISLAPHWADATSDTPIVAETWLARWQNALVSKATARAKMIEYSAKTAQWDGVGNKPYSRLFTNLLDTMPWVPGAADTIGRFSQNGVDGQQYIELKPAGPSGVSEPALRMEANPGADAPGSGGGDPCGGWNYALFADRGEYDHRKTYRLMNWVWREPGATGPLYLGTQSQNIGGAYNMAGQLDPNPYFWVNGTPEPHKWYLAVGVLHGSGYTGGDSGISGLYDPETGLRVQPGNDFRSHPGSTSMLHRAYQFYSQRGSVSFFARPSVEEVTSATISVEQIFATVGMTSVEAAQFAAARNAIASIASDAVLSTNEKDGVVREYQAILSEVEALYQRFLALGQPGDVQPPIAAAIEARDRLSDMLSNIAPPWNDVSQNSPIDTLLWKQRWNAAYDKLAFARAAITGRRGDPGKDGRDGVDGTNGVSALSAYLTNETFSHPTNASGGPNEIAGGIGDGQMRVFLGTQDVTGQCIFTVQSGEWLAVNIDGSGAYQSQALYADKGFAILVAVYEGKAIAKRLSATKAKAGTNGQSPPQVTIQANSQVILLNADGSLVENTGFIFTATRRNTGAGVSFVVRDGAGTPHRGHDGDVYGTDAADLLGIINWPGTHGQANTRFCTITATCDGATDDVTVIAVQNGRNGIDGRNGTDGAPGAPGADGRTSFFHVAYADSPNGHVNFTTDVPGGRAYQGSYTDFTAADSGNPADYVWTPYKGPPAFGLTGSGDTFVGGNALIKQGSGGWDTGGGYSTEGFRGGAQCGFASGQNTGTDIMAGLNTDPAANNSYESIDYAWYMASDGNAAIYESGAWRGTFVYGYGSGTFQVVYDNRKVRYLYNGAVYREIDAPADQLLYFDAAIAGGPGTRLNAISFGAAGRAGNDGRDGVPGTNGSNGQPGRDGRDGTNGINGADGRPSYVHIAYANSADGYQDFTTGSADGRFYIGIYEDASLPDSGNPATYTWTQLRGRDGNQGIPGNPGADGRTPYTHFAYANSPDGYADFTTDDGQALSRRYIGIRSDYVQQDSGNPADYTWSISRGADGAPGPQGPQGPGGPQGPQGPGGPAGRDTIVYYQDAQPSNPVFNDTWVTRSVPRIWRRWNGGAWEQILGTVAALEIIDSAYIADLAVGSAKIAELSVETLKIANQAVTSNLAVTAGLTTASNGETKVAATASFNASGLGFTRVDLQYDQGVNAQGTTGTARAFVRRTQNGQETTVGRAVGVQPASSLAEPASFWFVDTPAAGPVTYDLIISTDSGNRIFRLLNIILMLSEVKK